MREISAVLLCVLLLSLCACGTVKTPAQDINILLKDFSESDVVKVEDEFGISISPPVSLASLGYADFKVPGGRRATLSIRLEGISVLDFGGYAQLYEYLFGDRYLDGYAVNKCNDKIWIEDVSQSDKALRLEKHTISTAECRALLGLDESPG